MNQQLLNLVLALAAGELVHNIVESQEVRKKVAWLKLSLAGKPYYDSVPFEVDSRAKSYGLSLIGLVATTAILYGLFSWLDLSQMTALKVVAVALVLAYIATAVLLDKYHVAIGALTPTRPSKKQ